MDNEFKNGFEKIAGQAIMGFVHSKGLSNGEFKKLQESVKRQIDYRAKVVTQIRQQKVGDLKFMSAHNLVTDIVQDFKEHNKNVQGEVWAGGDIKLKSEMKKKITSPNFFRKLFGAKGKEVYSGTPDAMGAYVTRLDKGVDMKYKSAVLLGKHEGVLGEEGINKGVPSYFKRV